MITAPVTYAQWMALLQRLKDRMNDEEVLAAMYSGKLEWQSGVAERFSKKLIDTVNFRINAASDLFQKEMGRSGNQEQKIVQALMGLRKELSFLARAIALPVIPEESRLQYYMLVKDQADRMQKSLEDSAKEERSGKLESIVRNNKINNFNEVM